MKRQKYTDQDLETLKQNYHKNTITELSEILGRSYVSVASKLSSLGLSSEAYKRKIIINSPAFNCHKCGKEYPKEEYNNTCYHKSGKIPFCKNCLKEKDLKSNSKLTCYLKRLITNSKTRARKKKIEMELTIDQMLLLYKKQEGKCAITGQELTTFRGYGALMSNASIDRIDSKKGYIIENTQLVCYWANISKLTLDMDSFKKLISITYENLYKDDKQK